MAFCANCGTKIEEESKFCSGCGKAVGGTVNEPVAPVAQQQPVVLPQSTKANTNVVSAGNHEKMDNSGLSMEEIAQQNAVLQPQSPTADEMYCFTCGSVIKKFAEICPKCGVRQNSRTNAAANEQSFNGLAIISYILIFIGIIVFILARFLDWGIIIGRFGWWEIHDFIFNGGLILAFISLYKVRNKITMIAGIIAGAVYPFVALLYLLFNI
jgi:RNA polymerase subunit RPABC4/transcription elongation factor Spt4